MTAMRDLLVVTRLTLHEALRRRILLAAVAGAAAFLALYATGLHFAVAESERHATTSFAERRMMLTMLTLVGLYAIHFMVALIAVLLPLDTLSGEIQSGVIQTLAARPVRRRDIVLGKWLGHGLVMTGYLAMVAGGLLLIVRLIGGYTPPGVHVGLPLMLLEGATLLTLSIAGGTRLSTVTNGMLAFGLFGLAFIGNGVEQVGTYMDNVAARNVGTVASLLLPSEAMWQLAASHMQPTLLRQLGDTPFSPVSVPSPAMVVWALGYVVVVLAIGLRSFERRAL
jgi:ABC-type transport system involved in multi-copper enzyme maturation permease subunit